MEENKVAHELKHSVDEGGGHIAWQIWRDGEYVGEFYDKADAELWINLKEPK